MYKLYYTCLRHVLRNRVTFDDPNIFTSQKDTHFGKIRRPFSLESCVQASENPNSLDFVCHRSTSLYFKIRAMSCKAPNILEISYDQSPVLWQCALAD